MINMIMIISLISIYTFSTKSSILILLKCSLIINFSIKGLKIVSFHVTIQIKINEREICFTKILFPYPLLCLIKVGFESVLRTHLIFDSTSATAGGFKQYNTTVYFMTLFKMSTHDTELWISLGVRVFPEILSLNTFFWTTFYSSNIGKTS